MVQMQKVGGWGTQEAVRDAKKKAVELFFSLKQVDSTAVDEAPSGVEVIKAYIWAYSN